MSSQTPPPGYYSGPGGSSKVPNTGFNGWKILDPNNITGVGNKGSAPPTDFGQAAAAQGAAGQAATAQQTQANRPDQQGVLGGIKWKQNPDGSWTQTTSLAPGLQGASNNLQNQIANQGPLDNGSAAREQAISGAYNQAVSRLNPQFAQSDQQMASTLANQGLDPNSQAYRTAMQRYGEQKNDAYNQALYSAIGQGTAAQQATFNENLAAQNNPYQQLGQLQGFANGQPGFGAAGQAQPTPYLQAAEAAAGMLDKTNAQNSQNGSDLASGTMGMLGTIFSDERVKDDIHRLPVEVEPGIHLATYKYKGQKQHQLGVIAQDVEKVRPDAVEQDSSGFKLVNYPQLLSGGGGSGMKAGDVINPAAQQGMGAQGGSMDSGSLQAAILRMTPEQRAAMFAPYQDQLGILDDQATPQHHTTAGGAIMGGLGNLFANMDRKDLLKSMQADALARSNAVYGDASDRPFALANPMLGSGEY